MGNEASDTATAVDLDPNTDTTTVELALTTSPHHLYSGHLPFCKHSLLSNLCIATT